MTAVSHPAASPSGDASPKAVAPETATRSVLRGALALVSTQPLTWAASLLSAILVPHYLGATSLGQYSIAMSVAGLAYVVISLGVPGYLVRSVATHPTRAAIETGGALVLLMSLMAAASVLLALFVPFLRLPVPNLVLDLVLAGTILAAGQSVLFSLLVGKENHGRFAWFNAGSVIVSTCAGIAALATGFGLSGFLAASLAASGLSLAVIWRRCRLSPRRGWFDPRLLWALAWGGLPFLGWSLALQIYGSIDKLLLALLTHAAVVGWYAAAYRIIGIPVFIPTLVVTPLLPALSRCAGDRVGFEQTLRRSIVAVLVLTVPLSAMITALAPSIPGLLHWPADFRQSVPLMVILSLHLPPVAVDMVLATALFALKRERQWLCVGVVAAVFNPALNLLLIPVFEHTFQNGAIAAAIITVATELLMFVGAVILLPKGMVGRETVWIGGRTLFAGFCVWLVAALLRPVLLPLAVIVAAVTYAGLALGLRIVEPADLLALRNAALQSLKSRPAARG